MKNVTMIKLVEAHEVGFYDELCQYNYHDDVRGCYTVDVEQLSETSSDELVGKLVEVELFSFIGQRVYKETCVALSTEQGLFVPESLLDAGLF